MVSDRNTRQWRACLETFLHVEQHGAMYDGLCVLSPQDKVEYAQGCFSQLARHTDAAQFRSLFTQLTRREVLCAQPLHEQDQQRSTASFDRPSADSVWIPPSLLIGDASFQVVSTSFTSVCAVTAGRTRALIVEKTPFGLVLVGICHPFTLEQVLPLVDRYAAAWR